MSKQKNGPLNGLKVIEFSGIGPAPLAGQLMADLGAEVLTIDKKVKPTNFHDINARGKTSIVLNLKTTSGKEISKTLIKQSDVLIEGQSVGEHFRHVGDAAGVDV